LEGQGLVTLFGWILVVEIFVVSVMRVVVSEVILEEKIGHFMETACIGHTIPQVASTQLEVYLHIYVQNIYTIPLYLSILFRLSSQYPHSHSQEKTLPY
jgi:hypothetical protein